ncbi:palmitoyltransferase ZDHHC4-like [Patiria miniata]|uniref:Palmitoyltransferase n=1 Tax=Patiria miniata TaxID=46514 RepID=A0A913Z8A1_PATMI|nr:palmitoyltransferase ZDHHC4-like [Patiria miniata]XP_038047236.1 palmitoyltransferase ZDHHC4-like [Patiria miniata]XP_038047237.1 palmitoyltransferase ZDHHC4-like [Patiria miniata]
MADFLTLVAAYMVFFLLASYIILCGDSEFHRHGIVGKIRSGVVQIIAFLFYVCFPERLQNFASEIITYLFYKRNHYIQALYIAIFSGVLWVFATQVHPSAQALDLPSIYIIAPYVSMAVNLAIFVTCCRSDPGVITKKNHTKYASVFKYDGVLYQEGTLCQTCRFVKPARSKHCAYCNHCVHRFDHHCSWVNNCIGGRNVRYFLLLLASIAFVTLYVSYVTGRVLQGIAATSGVWQAGYMGKDGQFHQVDSRIVFQHLFIQLPGPVFLLTSLLLLGILITVFLSYHLFLLASNQTTNERYKRSRVTVEVTGSGGSGKKREQSLRQSRKQYCPRAGRTYDRGFVANILEIIFPPL